MIRCDFIVLFEEDDAVVTPLVAKPRCIVQSVTVQRLIGTFRMMDSFTSRKYIKYVEFLSCIPGATILRRSESTVSSSVEIGI